MAHDISSRNMHTSNASFEKYFMPKKKKNGMEWQKLTLQMQLTANSSGVMKECTLHANAQFKPLLERDAFVHIILLM